MVCNASTDMISGLPSDVIERILKLMPLKDATKTSILSKKWRYNWAAVSQLVFDSHFFEYAIKNNDFTNIINTVLLLHTGPIHKFIFCVPKSCYIQNSDVDRWILFLSRNGVRELTLDNSIQNPHKLPSYLFCCRELTHLELQNYTFKPPPAFEGFLYLRILVLKRITLTSSRFGSLISTFPLLERLTLEWCNGITHLHINVPNLKYLFIHGLHVSFRFINTPNLTDVTLGLISFSKWGRTLQLSNLNDVIGCLPGVERLSMSYDTLKFLAVGCIPKRLAAAPNFLKYLQLNVMNFCDLDQISWVLWLIRSSLNLQELEITASYRTGDVMEPVLNLMGKQNCADCYLDQLQKVKIKYIKGWKPELEFIKHLLAYSPVLELMIIECDEGIVTEAKLTMCRQLIRFSRASSKAEIIF